MKTIKKDFTLFKARFTHWQHRLGLTDWRIAFEHDRLNSKNNAELFANCTGRQATAYLNFNVEPNADILRIARHEALELLMADMDDEARNRYVRPDDLERARHAVIRRIENFIDQLEGKAIP